MKKRASEKVLGVALAVAAVLFWGAESRGESAVTPAVGVIRIDVPPGLSLVTVPMEQNDGTPHTLDSAFGSAFPANSQVLFYEPGTGYITYRYIFGGWKKGSEPAGSTPLPRGKGFWIKNYASGPVPLYLSGRVPKTQVSVLLPGNGGLQLTGFGFPVDLSINSIPGLAPAPNDEIIVFENNVYVTHKYLFGKWRNLMTNTESQFSFSPGVSVWYKRFGSETTWIQSLPAGIDL